MSLKETTQHVPDYVDSIHTDPISGLPHPGPSDDLVYNAVPSYTVRQAYIASPKEHGRQAKSCDHYDRKVAGSGPGKIVIPIYYGSGNWGQSSVPAYCVFNTGFGSMDYPVFGAIAPLASTELGGINDPPDLDLIVQRGTASLLPTIKADLLSVNSLIELKDVVSVKKSFLAVKQFAKLISQKGSFSSTATLRELLRVSSDLYLQKEFNFGPLLSDICGLQTALRRSKNRVNDLVSRSGKMQNRHFTYFINPYNSGTQYTAWSAAGHVASKSWPSSSYACETRVSRLIIEDGCPVHVQMQYNYNYTAYQREHAHILGLLDSLGVNLNPAIAWNLIPWSFVVDWVAKVGKFLSTATVHALEPQINILGALYSFKRRRTYYLNLYTRSQINGPAFSFQNSASLPSVVEEAYKRVPFMPDGSSIESSGLNAKEFSLGAALVLVQGKHSKHKHPHSVG